MLNDPAANFYREPLHELVTILLRQYKRLLAERGIELTEQEIRALGREMAGGQASGSRVLAIREALAEMVEQSEAVLAAWGLGFEESLRKDMNDMPGWETTAEFLEIANEKGNAELRIASGAALLVALGDLHYAPHVLTAIKHNPEELETVTARRILSQISGVGVEAADWQAQIEAWLNDVCDA